MTAHIRPQYGQLDKFISGLTGITLDDLKDAPKMADALSSFLDWVPDGDDVRIVSWSTADQLQLRHERDAYGIASAKLDRLLESWIDCQQDFDSRLGLDHNCALEEALIATDICTDGRAHDGLADARNTALLFAKMQREPELRLNHYYEAARSDAHEHLSCSFGAIMAAMGIQAGANA